VRTTLTPQELEGEARLKWAELAADFPRMHELPDPLKRCTRCEDHAAFYTGEGDGDDEFLCLTCGAKASAFVTLRGNRELDPRQVVADLALQQFENEHLSGLLEAERLLEEAK
jgi:hypothetical protein